MNAGAEVVEEPISRPRALRDLFEDIRQARLALSSARGVGVHYAARDAQEHLAEAIGVYIEALTARGLPVPYALRDEMRIYGRVLDPHRRPLQR